MDIRLFFRVFWRFWYIVLAGVLLGVALAFLSTFRVDSSGISYREQETYRAVEILELKRRMPPTSYAVAVDPSTLAQLYVSVATTDAVRTQLTSQRPPRGTYSASQVLGVNGTALPVIQVAGFAHTARGASRFANRGSDALKAYVYQDQASYPPSQQLYLKTLSEARGAIVFEGRRKTVPMIILFSVLTATFGFVLILENLRPQASAVAVRDLGPVLELADERREAEAAGGESATIEPNQNGAADQEAAVLWTPARRD